MLGPVAAAAAADPTSDQVVFRSGHAAVRAATLFPDTGGDLGTRIRYLGSEPVPRADGGVRGTRHHASSIGNQLQGAAAAKAKSVRDQLRGRLSAVLETWLREHRDATSWQGDDDAKAREQVAFAKQVAGANDDVQAFVVLDADGSGGISRRELGALVALLDVPTFDHAKVDQVFAYANENLDAVISPAEFEAAWTWVENEVVDALEAAAHGLVHNGRDRDALVLLLGLFIFIFQLVGTRGRRAARSAQSSSRFFIAATVFSVRYLPSSRRVLPEVRCGAEAKDV